MVRSACRRLVLPTPLSRQPSDIPWLLGVHRERGVEDSMPFNNAAERALRGFALGRKSWLFAGSERGADRAAAMTTLIMTARLNDIDPLAWLADLLARIADIPQSRLPELLPWECKSLSQQKAA
jgi:IS66 C-terminal element/Transposase IS66 family